MLSKLDHVDGNQVNKVDPSSNDPNLFGVIGIVAFVSMLQSITKSL